MLSMNYICILILIPFFYSKTTIKYLSSMWQCDKFLCTVILISVIIWKAIILIILTKISHSLNNYRIKQKRGFPLYGPLDWEMSIYYFDLFFK